MKLSALILRPTTGKSNTHMSTIYFFPNYFERSHFIHRRTTFEKSLIVIFVAALIATCTLHVYLFGVIGRKEESESKYLNVEFLEGL